MEGFDEISEFTEEEEILNLPLLRRYDVNAISVLHIYYEQLN